MTLTQVLKDVLGVSLGTTHSGIDLSDRATRLAAKRTDLALERNVMAAERTLMAWIRTSLSLISFGFTLGKLGDVLGSAKVSLLLCRTTDLLGVAYYLVIIGTVALILAAVQNRLEVAALFRQGLDRRPSLAFLMAVLLSLLGIFVFADLVTQFR